MKTKHFVKSILLGVTFLATLNACTGIPENIEPVSNFELNKYLGKWYEIARLDHRFERGLSKVSAEYSLREDGGIAVANQGFSAQKNQWKSAKGKAYFVDKTDVGHLKVSFWGPFYGAYIVFELDENYQYAFVSGPSKEYLWLLSRTPEVSDEVKSKFMALATEKGFELTKLVFTQQD